MKLENLVNGEELKKLIEESKYFRQERGNAAVKYVILTAIKSCTLSPAQLADENLKAWAVLEEFKEWLKGVGLTRYALPVLEHLESQAPCSDLVREIREDREKARAWEKLYVVIEQEHLQRQLGLKDPEEFLRKMDELLAKSKTPPTAEEEKKDDQS